MYLVFRCDCGRALYSKEGIATRKCVCGKTLKIKGRRIFKIVNTRNEASDAVRELQEEKFGGTMFKRANEL